MQQSLATSAVTRHLVETLWWLEKRSAFGALWVCVTKFMRISPVLFEIFQSGRNLFSEQQPEQQKQSAQEPGLAVAESVVRHQLHYTPGTPPRQHVFVVFTAKGIFCLRSNVATLPPAPPAAAPFPLHQ